MGEAFERIKRGLEEALAYAKAEPGTVFPPRDEWDIAAYDPDEMVAGYRDWRPDDPAPGPNHSPAYRWGWANMRKDITKREDGYEPQRRAFLTMTRRPN